MADSDEFAEFDTDEATFDDMLAQAEPAELVDPPVGLTMGTVHDIRIPPGLPISVHDPAATVAGRLVRQSRRRLPAVRRTQETVEVAG